METTHSDDGFFNSSEGHAANDLLSAYSTGDAEKLQTALASHVVSYLDNEVTRLSRTLKVPEGRTAETATISMPPPSREVEARAADAVRSLQEEIEEEGIM